MAIDVVAPKETGEKYPATVFKVDVEDGKYGPQLKVKLIEPTGGIEILYLQLPMRPKNRTGRNWVSLFGKYPDGPVDEQAMVGMTVHMVYATKKTNADEVVLDLLKPRTPDKDEDPTATVKQALVKEDLEAPF
jgi:hypothetical protein